MKEERKRDIYCHVCFASIASSISLILSLVVMLRYNYRTNLEIDYLGAIVAVMSLAVAVFVGVQIYQSFNLKRDIDRQNEELLKENEAIFLEKQKEGIEKYNNTANALLILINSVSEYNLDNNHDKAIDKFFEALQYANNTDNDELKKRIICQICDIQNYSDGNLMIDSKRASEYVKILMKASVEESVKCIEFIQSIKRKL